VHELQAQFCTDEGFDAESCLAAIGLQPGSCLQATRLLELQEWDQQVVEAAVAASKGATPIDLSLTVGRTGARRPARSRRTVALRGLGLGLELEVPVSATVQDVRQALWRENRQLAALFASGRELRGGSPAPESIQLQPLQGTTGEMARLLLQGKELDGFRFSARTARPAQLDQLAPGLLTAGPFQWAANWLERLTTTAVRAGKAELVGLVAKGGPSALAAARGLCRAKLGSICADSLIPCMKERDGNLNWHAVEIAIRAKSDHPGLIALAQSIHPSGLQQCMAGIRGVPAETCEKVAEWLRKRGTKDMADPPIVQAIRCLHGWGWCTSNVTVARSLIVKPITKSSKDNRIWLNFFVDLHHQIPEAEKEVLSLLKTRPVQVVSRLRTVDWVSDRVVLALKDVLLRSKSLSLKFLVLQVASSLGHRMEMMHIGIVEVIQETAGDTCKERKAVFQLALELVARLENGAARASEALPHASGNARRVATDASARRAMPDLLALRRAVLVAAVG